MVKSPIPNFLLIGAAKSGTTALYHFLNQHPQIFMSPVKEPHYFSFIDGTPDFRSPNNIRVPINHNAITNNSEYLSLFKRAKKYCAVGECSASYLYMSGTAENIISFNPDMKIIVSLRNPVDRAYSSYNHAKKIGFENIDYFEDAIALEKDRISENCPLLLRYIDLGLYWKQLSEYYKIFNKNNILVLLYDDFINKPELVMRTIFEFLEVDKMCKVDVSKKKNVGKIPEYGKFFHNWIIQDHKYLRLISSLLLTTKYRGRIVKIIKDILFVKPEKLTLNNRQKLIPYFSSDIKNTEQLISRDLTLWLN